MVHEISVSVPERSYRVLVADPADWDRIAMPELAERGKTAMLVTDENVGPLWSEPILGFLAGKGLDLREVRYPAGEVTKSIGPLQELYDKFLAQGLRRDGWVVALGGGVVGDLAGFAAATYLRGVAWLQIPTSLLAMVDASVGGKVGIDYAGGKNLVGAFHQPRLVLTSPQCLTTLPDQEFGNGLAEAIKAAIIGDPDLFCLMQEQAAPIWKRDPSNLQELIARSVRVKARIVEEDERETGKREVLNLGHTLGHAVEASSGLRAVRHGEAVAIGMVGATDLAYALGRCESDLADRVRSTLTRWGLPIACPPFQVDAIWDAMSHDKKRRGRGLRWVLPSKVGQVEIVDGVDPEIVKATLCKLGARSDG